MRRTRIRSRPRTDRYPPDFAGACYGRRFVVSSAGGGYDALAGVQIGNSGYDLLEVRYCNSSESLYRHSTHLDRF